MSWKNWPLRQSQTHVRQGHGFARYLVWEAFSTRVIVGRLYYLGISVVSFGKCVGKKGSCFLSTSPPHLTTADHAYGFSPLTWPSLLSIGGDIDFPNPVSTCTYLGILPRGPLARAICMLGGEETFRKGFEDTMIPGIELGILISTTTSGFQARDEFTFHYFKNNRKSSTTSA